MPRVSAMVAVKTPEGLIPPGKYFEVDEKTKARLESMGVLVKPGPKPKAGKPKEEPKPKSTKKKAKPKPKNE